jgi:uncharacterized small protein (DUF1192 family)
VGAGTITALLAVVGLRAYGETGLVAAVIAIGAGVVAVGVWPALEFIWNFLRAPRRLAEDRIDELMRSGEADQARIAQLQSELERLEEGRPKVEVSTDADGGRFLLVVRNRGAAAEFETQVEILEGSVSRRAPPVYAGCWDRSRSGSARILSGQVDRVHLATSQPAKGLLAQELLLILYDQQATECCAHSTTIWLVGSTPPQPQPWALLRVTLSSEPELADGPFVGTYMVDLHGIRASESLA